MAWLGRTDDYKDTYDCFKNYISNVSFIVFTIAMVSTQVAKPFCILAVASVVLCSSPHTTAPCGGCGYATN